MRLRREPLLQFLGIGLLLFGAHAALRDDAPARERRVVVSAAKIQHLATLFSRTWQRPPTRQELEAVVDEFVREEVAYREGLVLGIDRDDTIVRRRIRQKLEFVAEDSVGTMEPSEAELAAFFATHAEKFRIAPRFTFVQVFFNREREGDVDRAVAELIARLREDAALDASGQGDPTLLQPRYQDLSQRDVVETFGEEFAAALVDLHPGAWHGPIDSAYGAHAVLLEEVRPGRLPDLEEVRPAVRREWERARREDAIERLYARLLDEYEVTVEWSPNGAPENDS